MKKGINAQKQRLLLKKIWVHGLTLDEQQLFLGGNPPSVPINKPGPPLTDPKPSSACESKGGGCQSRTPGDNVCTVLGN